jgi:hypothetical protein
MIHPIITHLIPQTRPDFVDPWLCTEKKLSILLFCLFILSCVKHKSKQNNASMKLCNRNQEKMAEQQKGKALGESETGRWTRDGGRRPAGHWTRSVGRRPAGRWMRVGQWRLAGERRTAGRWTRAGERQSRAAGTAVAVRVRRRQWKKETLVCWG